MLGNAYLGLTVYLELILTVSGTNSNCPNTTSVHLPSHYNCLHIAMPSKLQGTHVLIIGGSSGVGFGVADLALSQGARVAIASSQRSRIDNAIQRLQASNSQNLAISGHAVDLSKPQELEANIIALLGAVTAHSGVIDHVVFTAGDSFSRKPLADAGINDILSMGNVRFLGPLILGKVLLNKPEYMSAGPKASITLTGGTNTHRPMPGRAVMAGWGSGVEGVARGLAVDLAPVRVNLVCLGAVRTELLEGFLNDENREATMKLFKSISPLDKIGSPEETAEAYAYCMACEFATGSHIDLDGGRCVK